MSQQNQIKSYEIIVGPNVKVVREKKSGAHTVHFPFEFPSTEEQGVVIVCNLADETWIPSNDITSIVINFK